MNRHAAEQKGRASMPPLIVVMGAPGSGKTTLALRLSAALWLPVFCKDDLKETLYEPFGVGAGVPPAPQGDVALSIALGRASFALLGTVADRLLAAGVGAVIEANFFQEFMAEWRGPRLARSRVAVVHCTGDPAIILRRYEQRELRGERHPGHDDAAALPRLRTNLATGAYDPPTLAVPLLHVDTTTEAEYTPGFDAIVSFCTSA